MKRPPHVWAVEIHDKKGVMIAATRPNRRLAIKLKKAGQKINPTIKYRVAKYVRES